MTSLAETQQQLLYYLQHRDSNIEDLVSGRTKAEVQRRLAIYREAYQLRLQENLNKQFPVLRAHLRGAAFESLALAYLGAYPPSHFAIRDFGRHLPIFLRDTQPYAEQAYLAELAQLEWYWTEIIDQAAVAIPLTTADLAQLKPEALADTCFQLQAHLRLQEFHYDIPPWRDQVKKTTKVLPPPTKLNTPTYYAMWHKAWQPYYRCLNPLEARFAVALQQGRCFGDLCAIATEQGDLDATVAAQIVAQTLLAWINDAWFTQTLNQG